MTDQEARLVGTTFDAYGVVWRDKDGTLRCAYLDEPSRAGRYVSNDDGATWMDIGEGDVGGFIKYENKAD